ncbi:hypothetical protein GCM10027416_28420 [Okibacterium endophyticum]
MTTMSQSARSIDAAKREVSTSPDSAPDDTELSTLALSHAGVAVERGRAESFAEWKELMGTRFVPLTITTTAPTFRGRFTSIYIEETCVTSLEASTHSVSRLQSQIRADDARHLKLSLQISGTGRVVQDGREAVLKPGDVAIYDTSRPYTLDYAEDVRALIMMFPHNMLGLASSVLNDLTAVRLPGDEGVGLVISPFMQHIAGNLNQLEGVNGVRIMQSALNLVTALLSAELEHHPAPEASCRADMEKFRLYIEKNLDDPDLCTVSVARAHFISARYLQYLFKEEGHTVSGYIRWRRLERCRVDLLDAALDSLSILQIAHRWGFTDGAHFSKVFKVQYGVSPRAYRANERLALSARAAERQVS